MHPGRFVWLGYCLNLAAPEHLDDLLGDLAAVSVPVRERLRYEGPFGVGLYLPAQLARTLANDPAQCATLAGYLREEALVPFTFNAFPYGGFQTDGVKREVFRPTWADEARLNYTLDVARVAAQVENALGGVRDGHVSISTHPGAFGAWLSDRSLLRRCAEGFGRAVGALAALEGEGGPRTVLALEAEPRASAGTSRALAEFLVFAREVAGRVLRTERGHDEATAARLIDRHLGTCLDACHAAVEFEAPADALRLAHFAGPLGKLQVSNALALVAPGAHPASVATLLALDEPRYLHQTTARVGDALLRVEDLGELRALLDGPEAEGWLGADEWRCHFHVPVDAAALEGGLTTTRATADELVRLVATDLAHWHANELHLEIETYTWSVLPGGARTGDERVAGIAREYEHVIGLLEHAGWDRDGSALEARATT
ncbi:MAG: metabolite traffic protein EboE [Planctomycetota bacterium]